MTDLDDIRKDLPQPPSPDPLPVDAGSYRSQRIVVMLLTVVFALLVLLEIVNVGFSFLTGSGTDFQARVDAADPLAIALALMFGVTALGYIAVFVLTIILYCVWVHRANRNARALGAEGMIFTPGWSVGWFFVPIASLFKPYQAVAEIYRASEPTARGMDWVDVSTPFVLKLWWGFWIVTGILGNIEFRLGDKAEEIARIIGLVNLPVGIVAAVTAVTVVRAIQSRLEQKARRLGL